MKSMVESAYRVVLLEDDLSQQRNLLELLSNCPQRELLSVAALSTVAEFEAYLAKGCRVDIFLCDISLNDNRAVEGCEFAEPAELPKGERASVNSRGIDLVSRHFGSDATTQVIYISGHVRFSSEVYRTNHTWFLLKPVCQEGLNRALSKAIENIEAGKQKPIGFVVDGSIVLVRPSKVLYVESNLRKVRIHTKVAVHEAYSSLSKVEAKFPRSFVRCHGSFLVNMDFVAQFEKDHIVLVTGEKVPVSQRQRKQVREAFAAYLIER